MKRNLFVIPLLLIPFFIFFSSNTYADDSRFCGNGPDSGIQTALGCINTTNGGGDLVNLLLKIGTGIGGGIALALMLYGVFIVTTSAGIPDKLNAGKEIITSAVVGLLFILLAVFLMNFIGINILGIPGLS